jgi:glutamyl-tRNA synthetase
MEDIDTPRVRPLAEGRIVEDLRWLGLDWDEGPDCGGPASPYRQSERTALYEAALAELERRHVVFPCDCSRSDIARAASAPHSGEEGPVYPGFCCLLPPARTFKRPPAARIAVPHGVIEFVDAVFGRQSQDVARQCGDFVLRRGDGVFAYQLAVVVDDLTQAMTEVVRGADLLSSTARQILLMDLLGARPPRFAHAPLVVGADNVRLAKRARGVSIRDYRDAGVNPRELVAIIARALSLAEEGETQLAPSRLVERFHWERIPRGPIRIDSAERLLR